MEKKLLALGSDGKLVVKSSDGKETSFDSKPKTTYFQKDPAVVFLLVDCSGSMEGEKIIQAKQGVGDFAKTAVRKGYRVGLIDFGDKAHLICEPTRDVSVIASGVEKISITGSTNLTDALNMASGRLLRKKGCRVVVVATDGCPSDPNSALEVAAEMKKDKIEILAISTSDADQNFLSELVSRKGLNLKVENNELRRGMDMIAKKLPVQFLEHKR
ncbi:MAG: vWA domain-containing protein [Candidatus Omnitrophota bacterium]|jgi:Mg-chelatase subunit ChlD